MLRGELLATWHHPDGSTGRVWQLVEFVPDAIVGLARSGRIVLASAHAEALFGCHRDELVGEAVGTLVHVPEGVWEPPPPGEARRVETVARRKDGTPFAVELRIAAVESDGELVLLVLICDVTARDEAALELARLRNLEAAARRTIHDLNNLLGIVLNYGQFAVEAAIDRPELQADLMEIIKAAERATALAASLGRPGRPAQRAEPAA
jgi:two-component system, cell cycle sensor histidine kinase and response regulator CckA